MRRLLLAALLVSASAAEAQFDVVIGTPTTTSLTANATACTVPGGSSCTVVLPKTDLTSWRSVVVSPYVSGANTVEDIIVEASSDGTHWRVIATLTNTASGASHVVSNGVDRYRFVRAEARASANSQTVVTVTGESS